LTRLALNVISFRRSMICCGVVGSGSRRYGLVCNSTRSCAGLSTVSGRVAGRRARGGGNARIVEQPLGGA
jgi:hypothetical protein